MMEGLLQPTHLLVLLMIILIVFGPRKLPELGQGLGKGIRGFKDSLRGIAEEAEGAGRERRKAPAERRSVNDDRVDPLVR